MTGKRERKRREQQWLRPFTSKTKQKQETKQFTVAKRNVAELPTRLLDHNKRKEAKIAELEKQIYQKKEFKALKTPSYLKRGLSARKTEEKPESSKKEQKKEEAVKPKKSTRQSARRPVKKPVKEEQPKIEDVKAVRARLDMFYRNKVKTS